MRNLLNPKWLLIINTLPIGVLYILYFSQFGIIKSLLDESSIQLWKTFGITLGVLATLNLAYSIYLILNRKSVTIWYSLAALLLYISFLYLYGYYLDQLLPFAIPEWMISGDIYLYAGTFLMPTLAYSLFVLVANLTPESKEYKAWVNFLIAIGIPICAYLFSQIILPLWQRVESDFFNHALVVLVIVVTLTFLFFLVRGVFILATKKGATWQRYQLIWKVPIAVVFPVLGLLMNNGHILNEFQIGTTGIFGDFNNHWFYILAVINGLLICLPNLKHKVYRLLLFVGRSITFAYTFYFFMVFLPFLPLSVIAIIVIGTGFLMLTPLLLFSIQANELSKDHAYLKLFFSNRFLVGVCIISFLIIPTFITIDYLKDKSNLNQTLAYIYSPDYSRQYHIDKSSLQNTLDVIKGHKDNRRGMSRNEIPFLSSYFNWLVLDNLTLSDSKINTIEEVFFGHSFVELWPERIQNDQVQISNISTSSTYDETQNAWRSWVDLEITNCSEHAWFSEYATTIKLPEGCWISDYYLYVGDKKEPGILAEKKSAMWVYSQIRNENRDPGILYYLTGNKVAFRVFPFSKDEVRKTGIQFLHKEPVTLSFDNYTVELGKHKNTAYENIETNHVAYLSTYQKQSLNAVKRKPYFHFLVDASKGKSSQSADFIKKIEQVLGTHQSLSENAQISFVNSYVNTIGLNDNWKDQYQSLVFEGGYYLDRAIKATLVKANNKETYPIMVAVTDSIQNAILDKDFSDLKFTFPESNIFFNLGRDGSLRAHSLTENPVKPLPDSTKYTFQQTVLEYKLSDGSVAYVESNNEPSIILKNDHFDISATEIKEKNWLSGLNMQGRWKSQVLQPEASDRKWLNMVKHSFISKIMTPVTSYLVVENEAQKAILKKKQQQVLSGNKSLDLDEDTPRMTEPGLITLIILLGLFLWLKAKRKPSRPGSL